MSANNAMISRRKLLLLAPLATLSACAEHYRDPYASRGSGDFGHLTYNAVDRLVQSAPEVTTSTPVIVASITDTEQLDHTSRFGDTISDLARSRLAQRHMTVLEERLRTTMLMRRDEGEMMLGRDPKTLVRPPDYSVILTGTYAPTDSQVIVDMKLISASSSQVLSAVDYMIWRSPDITALLVA